MGYRIILRIECVLKDEYIDDFNLLRDYLYENDNEDNDEDNDEDIDEVIDEDIDKVIDENYDGDDDIDNQNIEVIYNNIPDNLKVYGDIWKSLKIGHYFHNCDLNDNILKIKLEKKPYRHDGRLEDDYITFINNIIVPISSLIINCEISHDDYDFKPTIFTDDELRKAKYINAYLIQPETLKIQYGKRLQTQPKKQKDIDVSYIKIYPDIYNSESETWPESLHNWWNKISYDSTSKDEIIKISNDI